MKFYKTLQKELKRVPVKYLPRSYQIIGKVLLVKLKPEAKKYRKAIGKAILEILPYIDSVLWMKGVSGKERKPKTVVIAGSRKTEALHKEHGCSFWIDPSKIMFSKGNKFEKLRLLAKIKKGDTVVDMFAGIGYWSIPIAKQGKSSKIYAMDINPLALSYLERNVRLNKCKVTVLKGDCRKYASLLKNQANRVIMGYFGTLKFFNYALRMAKTGATIHYHDLIPENQIKTLKDRLKKIALTKQRKISFSVTKKVKSYAPGVVHIVLDIKVK